MVRVCENYTKTTVFFMVFVDLGKIAEIATKVARRLDFGATWFPSWANLGQDGTKLRPSECHVGASWDKLGQVGAKLGQVGGKRGRILDMMVENGGGDGHDRPR